MGCENLFNLNLGIIQVLKIVACSDTIHFVRIRPESSGSAIQIGMSRMTHSWLNQSSKIKCSKPINRRVRPGTWNSTQRCIRLALTCVCVTVRLDFVTYLYNIGKYSSEPEQDDYPFSSLFLVHVLFLFANFSPQILDFFGFMKNLFCSFPYYYMEIFPCSNQTNGLFLLPTCRKFLLD